MRHTHSLESLWKLNMDDQLCRFICNNGSNPVKVQTAGVHSYRTTRMVTVASSSLASPYVLSNVGAQQLAEMTASGSAPIASPGFSSNRIDPRSNDDKLTRLQELVRARPSIKE